MRTTCIENRITCIEKWYVSIGLGFIGKLLQEELGFVHKRKKK
jgi:hypothetical protein